MKAIVEMELVFEILKVKTINDKNIDNVEDNILN